MFAKLSGLYIETWASRHEGWCLFSEPSKYNSALVLKPCQAATLKWLLKTVCHTLCKSGEIRMSLERLQFVHRKEMAMEFRTKTAGFVTVLQFFWDTEVGQSNCRRAALAIGTATQEGNSKEI